MSKLTRKKAENAVPDGEKVLIAKKDWRILSGDYLKDKGTHEVDIQVKAGDDCSKIPERFLEVLRTEKVI